MAAPVYINAVTASEGAELVRSLGRHGLSAHLVRSGEMWQVEVRSPHEDPRTFLADLGIALAAWSGGDRDVRAQSEYRGAA